MDIGIDVRKIGDTGIGRYIENLVERLLVVDDRHRYTLFFARGEAEAYPFPTSRVRKVTIDAPKYSLKEQTAFSDVGARFGIDIFHAPHFTLPFFLDVPSVVTIHDIIHLQDKGQSPMVRTYARLVISSALRRATLALTVSEASRQAILEYFLVEGERVRVTHNGCGDFSRLSSKAINHCLAERSLSPGYLLFVGSDRPHKNIRAVYEVAARTPDSLRIVVVGRVEDKSPFKEFGDRIVFTGPMEKDDLACLYSGAACLLMPSFYEGFGLPPLEAMSCGTAVVSSNTTSLPEVCGDAALYADPHDYATMAQQVMTFIEQKDIRERFVQRGYEQAKRFSWDETARKTLAAYEEVQRRNGIRR